MSEIINRAKKIRLVIFDVDGVLTDGILYYGKTGDELKAFNVRDGQGIKLLLESGIEVGSITARQSEIVVQRMQWLGIKHVYQGSMDKLPAYEELKKKLNLTDEQIAYIGDDIPDLPLLRRVGLPITVADAPAIIQKYAYWTTKAKGGKGAAREVCDLIMEAQGTYLTVINKFLER